MWRLFFAFLVTPIFSQLIDLEEHPQDFVLETKQIIIPEFPHAFNPAIIRYEGKLLLSFRTIPDLTDKFKSNIYVQFLDDEFEPASPPQLIELRPPHSIVPCRAEDARFLQIKDRLYMIYSDNEDLKVTGGGFRMYIAELCFDGYTFQAINVERLSEWEGQNPIRREKNWTPFEYKDQLMLAYSLDPHFIVTPLFGTEFCETIAETQTQFDWNWGTLRGGTQALPLNPDSYLGFFHSQTRMASIHSEGKEMLHYFFGAYTFSSEPPFQITSMSPEPIWGKNFYHGQQYERYWGSVRVVFPCGLLFDDQYIWITYGRQDHELWVVKLDKQGLLDSLVPTRLADQSQ